VKRGVIPIAGHRISQIIKVGANTKRCWADIERRMRSVKRRVRCRSESAEKYARDQAAASQTAREISAARIKAAKPIEIHVVGNIAVATENTTKAVPKIGNNHDISFVVSGAGLNPGFPLAHFIGRSHVCISVSAPNLQATELVDQEEVDHTRDRVRSIHSRGAIFKDVNVIDHRERYQVDVRAAAEPCNAQ